MLLKSPNKRLYNFESSFWLKFDSFFALSSFLEDFSVDRIPCKSFKIASSLDSEIVESIKFIETTGSSMGKSDFYDTGITSLFYRKVINMS